MNGIRTRGAVWLALLAACAGLTASCGGVGTGGTGAFASGPITGFGSIIVNGVHFDEDAARIEDDDAAVRDRTDLRLGTVVEIDSSPVRDGAAVASRVRIVSELVGRVDTVGNGMLVVNGLNVRLNTGTVFDDRFSGGLAGIVAGRVVEVYGFVFGGSGELLATRVEPRDNATAFKFRGIVSALNTQARTFNIGGQAFAYPAQVTGRTALRNGALVRVITATARDAQSRWPVSVIASGVPDTGDREEAKTRGLITAFTSDAAFEINGAPVNASGARIEGGPLAAGLRVEVEGRLQEGVLLATKVEVEDEAGGDSLEMNGTIASVDSVNKTFRLNGRSERVSYARSDVVFEDGSVANLAVGRRVKVTGLLSADGTQVEARRIHFDD